jgi:outer membrane protein
MYTQVLKSLGIMLFFVLATTAQAQKYGHMNMGNFLETLPVVVEANKELQKSGVSFEARLDSMEKDLQAFYTTVSQQANSGALTRIQMEEAQKQLETKQTKLKAETEVADKALADKRAALLEPILKKVEDAVKQVAKENNYLMVFDTSVGATLFVTDSDDISALVAAKLK